MKNITILNQTWTTENLIADSYTNGDKIPYAANADEWRIYSFNQVGCYCFYGYNEQNKEYGKLYNWYAVNDNRGLAPKNWKIPSDKDWDTLIENLGGSLIAGKFLKSSKFENSYIHEDNKNNLEFNILPSGYHGGSHSQLKGFNAHFWTSTNYLDDYAWLRFVTFENDFVGRSFDYKSSGFAVRLIKSDSNEVVHIGNQKWSKQNLSTTIFANGDTIPIAYNSEELIYFSQNKIPCCCSYNFDDNLVNQFGRLYNWYAVNDSRGLIDSSIGYVPTDDDWTELVQFLGEEKKIGELLKITGNIWGISNLAKDELGFSAQPAGYFGEGYFATLNYNAVFWSSTEYLNDYAWLRLISYDSSNLDRGFDYKKGGYSVRYLLNK